MKFSSLTKERVASFLVPVLIAVVLLYQVLADLQIAVTHGATLLIIGVVLALAAAAGVVAALGPPVVRVVVLAACALLFLDVTFHLSGVFDRLKPEVRARMTQDEQRIADIRRIKSALDQYVARYGALPAPSEYGEGTGPVGWWDGWWDLSSEDVNGDGSPFLDFLVTGGVLPSVPVDPRNAAAVKGDPRGGNQYIYFLVPPGYDYSGGTCDARPNRWHYMIGVTSLEEKAARTTTTARNSTCSCLWRDAPDFFKNSLDYALCGTFDATPEVHARATALLAQHAAAAVAAKDKAAAAALAAQRTAELQQYAPKDERRVADLLRIRKGLQKYLAEVGPLPMPSEYGEADSSKAGFWSHYWDLSAQDADGDGAPFLDFLVDSGVMQSVPVDPDNQPAPDGSPTGGRQYAYFVASPNETYEGGTCASGEKKSVYLLGITDLESERGRPPAKIAGSGCDCLWQKSPNFFQQQFDYIVCGTFDDTPERRARAAEILRQRAAKMRAANDAAANAQKAMADAALAEKHAAELRKYVPRDERRVSDLLRIRQALQQYLDKVGPLPAPSEYGEAESSKPGFWSHYWDVSSEDGDHDGKPFLDFLVEKGIMPSVPVDPDNQPAPDGGPTGGRQFVYFVAPPSETYAGGTCAASKKDWVYLLGITDLQSEETRPPVNIHGSGCDCLWRDQPNFFQQNFDYVVCGTFRR